MINNLKCNYFSRFLLGIILFSSLPGLSCGLPRKRKIFLQTSFEDDAKKNLLTENDFFPRLLEDEVELFDRLLVENGSFSHSMSYNNDLSDSPSQKPSTNPSEITQTPSISPSISSSNSPSTSPSIVPSKAPSSATIPTQSVDLQLRTCGGMGSYDDSNKEEVTFYYKAETTSNDNLFLSSLESILQSYALDKMCNTRRLLSMNHDRKLALVGINTKGSDEIIDDNCDSADGNYCFVVRSTLEIGVDNATNVESTIDQTLINVKDFMFDPPEELKQNTTIVNLTFLGTNYPTKTQPVGAVSQGEESNNVGLIVGIVSGSALIAVSIALFVVQKNNHKKKSPPLLPLEDVDHKGEETADENENDSDGISDVQDDIHTMVTVEV